MNTREELEADLIACGPENDTEPFLNKWTARIEDSRWRTVPDEMPLPSSSVLAFGGGRGPDRATWTGDSWMDSGDCAWFGVTHWRPNVRDPNGDRIIGYGCPHCMAEAEAFFAERRKAKETPCQE